MVKQRRPTTTKPKAAKPRKGRSPTPKPVSFEPLCRACNGKPVADVTFRAVRGFVIFFNSEIFEGPYCRTCGEAVYRSATARTMLGCWWGALSAGTGIRALLSNRRNHKTVLSLSEPESGDASQRLDPGKPVWRRPGGLVGAAMLGVIAFAIFAIVIVVASGPSALYEDECITLQDSTKTIEIVDCGGPHDGKVVGVVDTGTQCPDATNDAISLEDDPDLTLCVDADA